MSNPQDNTRSIEFAGCEYVLRLQGYQYASNNWANTKNYHLVLKTHIEVTERPLSDDNSTLIAMAANKPPIGNKTPEQHAARYPEGFPVFVKLGTSNFYDQRLEFIGDYGFKSARTLLNSWTDAAIITSINTHLLDGGILKPHILKVCIKDPFRGSWMCIYETKPMQLITAPPRWVHEKHAFRHAQDYVEDGVTYSSYIPSDSEV